MMIEGHWIIDEDAENTKDGSFRRAETQFHCAIGDECHPVEENRYHLYVSLACPWAHRTLIMRHLKGLDTLISISIVHPHMLDQGWEFRPDPEPLYGATRLYELYTRANPHYSGRVSVPLLWDKKEQTIVCNESAEITRMLNTAFDTLTGNTDDYYPATLQSEIDGINTFVYDGINNGVYRCGFATTQHAYDKAFDSLFVALDSMEKRLEKRDFLVGEKLTEADIRLYTTLIRFDVVYYSHFKCNRNRISDMPNLWRYLRCLYAMPAFHETTNFEHIKQHYYYSHASINPTRIVPKGPELHFDVPTQTNRI